jgi:hypothetical protein
MRSSIILLLCTINIALVFTHTELTFLGEVQDSQVEKLQEIAPIVINSVDFVEGFNRGLSFFYNLPNQNGCENDNQQLVQDLVGLYHLVQNFNQDTDVRQFVEQLQAAITDALSQVTADKPNCQAWSNDAVNVLNGLSQYVRADNYIALLALHTVANVGNIKTSLENAFQLVQAGKYSDAGQAYGETLRLVYFWDFKN